MSKKYRRYKNIIEKFLDSNNGQRFFNIVYSVGAAIVILGAMFKLLHLPLGNLMLMVGMITEAIVFLLSALEKPAKDYKWEEVYPVLAEDDRFIPKAERKKMSAENQHIFSTDSKPAIQETSYPSSSNVQSKDNTIIRDNSRQDYIRPNGSSNYTGNKSSQSAFVSKSSQQADLSSPPSDFVNNIDSNAYAQSQRGSYTEDNTTIVQGSDVAQASKRYAEQLNTMTENMAEFAKVTSSLGNISETLISSFQSIIDNSQGIGNNTQGYINQLDALNRNIAGLNTIYEIQLKGVSGQINTIEEINAGLDRMKKLYSGSLVDSSLFKNETEKMAKQLSELNSVYARLLQAMTTNMNMGGGFNPGSNNNPKP